MLGSVVAVLGIGLFALPAGLLAAGFTDELEKRRMGPACPTCGQPTAPGAVEADGARIDNDC